MKHIFYNENIFLVSFTVSALFTKKKKATLKIQPFCDMMPQHQHFGEDRWGQAAQKIPIQNTKNYQGADKSLARPGRKQATATKL